MITSRGAFRNLLSTGTKIFGRMPTAEIHNRSIIGNRDWVAFGRSGFAYYDDAIDYPFPAIRFKENTNELLALREKEKGDWRKLSIEEKKTLYRASFRQTLSEVTAPTGEWKSIMGWTLLLVSLGLWSFIISKLFIYQPRPDTFKEENRRKMLRKMLDLKIGILNGVSSHWDYEQDKWKQ